MDGATSTAASLELVLRGLGLSEAQWEGARAVIARLVPPFKEGQFTGEVVSHVKAPPHPVGGAGDRICDSPA